jgi:hypothetical protein
MPEFENIQSPGKQPSGDSSDGRGKSSDASTGTDASFIPTAPHRSEVIDYSPNRNRERRENSAVERIRQQRARRAKKYADFAKTADPKLLVGAKPVEEGPGLLGRLLIFIRSLFERPSKEHPKPSNSRRGRGPRGRGRRPAGQNRSGESQNRRRGNRRRNDGGGRGRPRERKRGKRGCGGQRHPTKTESQEKSLTQPPSGSRGPGRTSLKASRKDGAAQPTRGGGKSNKTKTAKAPEETSANRCQPASKRWKQFGGFQVVRTSLAPSEENCHGRTSRRCQLPAECPGGQRCDGSRPAPP